MSESRFPSLQPFRLSALAWSRLKTITVHRKGKPDVIFDRAAYGAAGVKLKVRRGDDVTPIGIYTIGWITKKSKFAHLDKTMDK